jgi:hypothetical protein
MVGNEREEVRNDVEKEGTTFCKTERSELRCDISRCSPLSTQRPALKIRQVTLPEDQTGYSP